MAAKTTSTQSNGELNFLKTLDEHIISDLIGEKDLPDYSILSAEQVKHRLNLIRYADDGSPIFKDAASNFFDFREWLDFLQAYDGITKQTKNIVSNLVAIIHENELAGSMGRDTAWNVFVSFYKCLYEVRKYSAQCENSDGRSQLIGRVKINSSQFDALKEQLSGLDAKRAVVRFAQYALDFCGIKTAYQFESDLLIQRFFGG